MPNAAYYKTPHWRNLRRQRLILDGYKCTVPGCPKPAKVVEHTVTRSDTPYPCEVDRIDLTRSLCRGHDNQTKEIRKGRPERKSGGKHTVTGCDADGLPLDPNHPWRRGK